MKSVIALALLSVAFAAPQGGSNNAALEKRQFSPAELDAFFDSLSSLLGQLPTVPVTDILTFSTSVSGTPTEVPITTTAAFDDGTLPFAKRQSPADLEAIISSLSALISTTATPTEAIGCATDVVDVPTTVNGVPTEVSSVAAVPTAVAPTAAPAGAPAAPAAPGGA
ncbi:uncharacterized protein FFB20_10859 [Fusarium fujikuroi]|uniref:Uncharacterized protein n=2 Tax=Fusarium fujikuroi TaxID=5127 RepID=S0DQR5_GIBF5|nr:uncharacterized protein FFUJ_03970 [Fusarium fujikuroi IMI 58289]KLP05281.1 uncharacterized protein LW94_9636 [Fusarium fujikuroi]QGI61108.1 hypothetical protein CEK27_005079 [Fusarium fujikuroi]QGI78286.1 hypothetical protein CEK25_005015 [Fusarium fujikuroi]QGI92007.1 hypothetical protein CEK26_005076 [Fusarium fujikuroi]CCT64776.1 uncharacterized protein FFUJ_03970 [Fusarium fujikuroi IMI 58289]